MLAEREIIAEAQIPRVKHDVLRLPDLFRFGRVAFDGAARHPRTAVGKHLTHVAEHFVWSAVGDYAADVRIGFGFAQHDDAVNQVEPHVDMMFHHNQRLMGLFEDVADSVVHFLDTVRVKVGGRFVKQQQARVHGQHARQGEALTLPAGKSSCGAVERHVVEPDDVKGGSCPVPDFIFRQVQVLAAECGVVSGTFENRLRVRVLKHQPTTSARLSGVDASMSSSPSCSPSSSPPSTPAKPDIRVDLPAPDAPSNSTRSPGLMSKSTCRSAKSLREACLHPQSCAVTPAAVVF